MVRMVWAWSWPAGLMRTFIVCVIDVELICTWAVPIFILIIFILPAYQQQKKKIMCGAFIFIVMNCDMTRVGPTSLHVIPCNILEHLPLPIWSLDVCGFLDVIHG